MIPLSCIERHAHHLPLGTDMLMSVFQYNGDSSTPIMAMALNPVTYLGRGATGVRDGNIAGLAPSGPRGMPGHREYAAETNVPFETLAKNEFITDTSIFDFYNRLIDGDIKREKYDFSTFDAPLSQTFFNGKPARHGVRHARLRQRCGQPLAATRTRSAHRHRHVFEG